MSQQGFEGLTDELGLVGFELFGIDGSLDEFGRVTGAEDYKDKDGEIFHVGGMRDGMNSTR